MKRCRMRVTHDLFQGEGRIRKEGEGKKKIADITKDRREITGIRELYNISEIGNHRVFSISSRST